MLDEEAGPLAPPESDHDRHRRRQSQCAGAGYDKDSDGSDQAMGQTRLRPPDTPHAKGNERDQQDGGNEPSRDLVGQALDRCPRTLRSEEHTSELQSLMRISYAVFCLKKTNWQRIANY